ncbi:hypothetical protein KC19_VG321100 [Ceratodon purpureus]|uniref:Uncharacterized protein n=1 Tax=Ceratodon purpureus TaxID=3225 RepID=A0A8T0HWA8_CERPU|nr:hypothetical protein KC19_VG321100 [Ceratodon purpureus]
MDVKPCYIPAMPKTTMAGMVAIRPGILKCIESERMRLRAAAHDVGRGLKRTMTRLNQERDHLKFLNRKKAKKSYAMDRAVEEHKRALEMLLAARSEEPQVTTSEKEHAPRKKSIPKICDALVRSWAENVESSHRSLSRWEFNSRRQAVLVDKAKDDVQAAEVTKAADAAEIEVEIFQMHALSQFVKDL